MSWIGSRPSVPAAESAYKLFTKKGEDSFGAMIDSIGVTTHLSHS